MGNTIGGTTPGAGNLISGNRTDGIHIISRSNIVQGNLIGTDGLKRLSHGCIIADAYTGFTAQGLDQVILALGRNPRHALLPGKIRAMVSKPSFDPNVMTGHLTHAEYTLLTSDPLLLNVAPFKLNVPLLVSVAPPRLSSEALATLNVP